MNALDTHYKHRLLHRERGFFCVLRKDRKTDLLEKSPLNVEIVVSFSLTHSSRENKKV